MNLDSLGLRLQNDKLEILDQRLLPDEEKWVHADTPEKMIELIKTLAVRGAPLIGVSAALSLGLFAKKSKNMESIRTAARHLREARPTAVNLMWAMDQVMEKAKTPEQVYEMGIEIFRQDVAMSDSMSENGASLVKNGEGILTICNTGGLATVGIGTALGAIRRAHEQGKNIHVYFCETRPLLQGGRLTAWELQKLKIPHTLIGDSMAATLLRKGKIQRCFVGADRIARNGDFANKIGTYQLAVLCNYHKVPFYTVAPESTVDVNCPDGASIPVEERNADEVRGVSGSFGSVRWAPKDVQVFNPAFDVTPAELLAGIVLDSGIYDAKKFSEQYPKKGMR